MSRVTCYRSHNSSTSLQKRSEPCRLPNLRFLITLCCLNHLELQAAASARAQAQQYAQVRFPNTSHTASLKMDRMPLLPVTLLLLLSSRWPC